MDDLTPMELLDKAIEKVGYEFMTDVTVKNTIISFFIYSSNSFEITGTGWKNSGSQASLIGEKSNLYGRKKEW